MRLFDYKLILGWVGLGFLKKEYSGIVYLELICCFNFLCMF